MTDNKIPTYGSITRPESQEDGLFYLIKERISRANDYDQIVEFHTDEFTCICPKTGQPDFGQVIIRYIPSLYYLESKAMKFYLWAYREIGGYCEELSASIAADMDKAISPKAISVTFIQNKRGGLNLKAETRIGNWNNEKS